jgi:hypothetical protein
MVSRHGGSAESLDERSLPASRSLLRFSGGGGSNGSHRPTQCATFLGNASRTRYTNLGKDASSVAVKTRKQAPHQSGPFLTGQNSQSNPVGAGFLGAEQKVFAFGFMCKLPLEEESMCGGVAGQEVEFSVFWLKLLIAKALRVVEPLPII